MIIFPPDPPNLNIMYYITVNINTSEGFGHISAIVKDNDILKKFIESIESVCKEQYEWYKIVSIDKKIVDEDGNTHAIN